MKAQPSPLSSRPKRRDLRFCHPLTNFHGSATLPFVIPSEAEGSAVLSSTNQLLSGSATLPFVIPSEAEGSAVPAHPLTNFQGSATLPFVIPSEAAGSAVLSSINQLPGKRNPPLCHPDRSAHGGICSSVDPSWKCFSKGSAQARNHWNISTISRPTGRLFSESKTSMFTHFPRAPHQRTHGRAARALPTLTRLTPIAANLPGLAKPPPVP